MTVMLEITAKEVRVHRIVLKLVRYHSCHPHDMCQRTEKHFKQAKYELQSRITKEFISKTKKSHLEIFFNIFIIILIYHIT